MVPTGLPKIALPPLDLSLWLKILVPALLISVVLECPAINAIDLSALESLAAVNHRLKDAGIAFHLSEVKGPILDRLKRSHFLKELTGKVHLSHYDALFSINPVLTQQTSMENRDGSTTGENERKFGSQE